MRSYVALEGLGEAGERRDEGNKGGITGDWEERGEREGGMRNRKDRK